jgi:hyperosmotically inducible protein
VRHIHVLLSIFLALTLVGAAVGQTPKPASPQDRDGHPAAGLNNEIRHELVMMPYYSVFDWLQAEVQPNGKVILSGEVTRPTLKKDAESRVRNLEGVSELTNNIEVLPLSDFDDDLRTGLYRAIYRYDSPLFRYALQSVGPIHIIVKNGHVTLKGVVASEQDSQLAYMAARQVPGAFEVKNELQVESEKTIS